MRATTGTDIGQAATLLKAGQLVAFPTETVYGLGANALDASAVAKVFEAKQRPEFDPLIVHVGNPEWLGRIVSEVPALAKQLIDRFWPGPLTIVLPKRPEVPDLVTSGLGTVGVRQPNHPLALELIRAANIPVAAPSANLFGRISPTTASHVTDQLAERVDYVLDGGPCSIGVESTVVTVSDDSIIVLRPGGLTIELLKTVTERVELVQKAGSNEAHASPGQTLQHYAPRTPLIITESPARPNYPGASQVGLMTNQKTDASGFAVAERLSSSLPEAAAQFFAALRRLDEAGLDLIVATPFANEGLGIALNDRLNRAANGSQHLSE